MEGALAGAMRAYSKWADKLPSHMFISGPFSVAERLGSLVNTAGQYLLIGTSCGVSGYGLTLGLVGLRERLTGRASNVELPPLWGGTFGWATFMAFNSNPRFHLCEGLELSLARLLSEKDPFQNGCLRSAIAALRYGNNFFGAKSYIWWNRKLGLQQVIEPI
uniref:Uncharacterized protein n=1 Tax=Vitrella brassicaformis TaxID=1169539 RepID=A0A7S1KA33_9ALVE